MSGLVWGGALATCLVAAGLIVMGPLRRFFEKLTAEKAREQFRARREYLEVDFMIALGKTNPTERVRWEEGYWHDEILWARDCQTRRLLALIGVDFGINLFEDLSEPSGHHATALFEFRKGRWYAEGKRLDEIRPDEVVRRNQRFVPVIMHPRRGF
jgi:hypothetical protein